MFLVSANLQFTVELGYIIVTKGFSSLVFLVWEVGIDVVQPVSLVSIEEAVSRLLKELEALDPQLFAAILNFLLTMAPILYSKS